MVPDDLPEGPSVVATGGSGTQVRDVALRPTYDALLDSQVGSVLAGRFELVRRIGNGGMGVVYEAADRAQAGTRVALKTLTRLSPSSIYRIKNEFRRLADVVDPHLVTLHELFSHEGHWFFTMQLVEGVHFDAYVRTPDGGYDRERVVSTLRQLTEGVMAIHAAGKLHRDIKPTNVLVTPEGKVVIVDFGLARDSEQSDAGLTDPGFVGTPAYAAPEQLDAASTTAASDWYSVGVMLYEALTGKLPFEGSGLSVMLTKQRSAPTPPSSCVEGIDPGLEDLCMRLLAIDPAARATGADVLEALPTVPTKRRSSDLPHAQHFVGRGHELTVLHQAFDTVSAGTQVALLVQGASGIGKTALVERFLRDLALEHHAEVFTGRCYAHEQVPYKAFDGIIDALSRYLCSIPAVRAAALLPRDTRAMAQIFPVLHRVPALAELPQRSGGTQSEAEIRARGFQALKQLLGTLADRRPVVLFIDDLQWSDDDSIDLLRDLLSAPDAPAILLIATCRAEERESNPALSKLYHARSQLTTPLKELRIGPMSSDERRTLARELLGAEDAESSLEWVADQCEGHPMFLWELARLTREHRERAGSLTLDDALSARIHQLPEPAQRLLEVICMAGRPIARDMALEVAGLASGGTPFTELRVAALVRAHASHSVLRLEPYHDRVREVVVDHVPPSQRDALHLRIARAYLAQEPYDLEAVVSHFAAAGRHDLAQEYAESAAEQALSALAFNRAAELLNYALTHGEGADLKRHLHVRLSEVCTAAGQNRDAARHLLEAASLSRDAAEAFDYRRIAMEHFFYGGFNAEGGELFDTLAKSQKLRLPSREWLALLLGGIKGLALILRGGPDVEAALRSRGQPFPERLNRQILLLWSGGSRHVSSPILGGYYMLRILSDAARSGATAIFAVAVVAWLGFMSAPSGVLSRRGRKILTQLEELTAAAPNNLKAWYWAGLGTIETYTGNFLAAVAPFERALSVSAGEGARGASPQHFSRAGLLVNWFWTGDLLSFQAHAGAYIRSAAEAFDKNYSVGLRIVAALRFLIEDDPATALKEYEDALAHVPPGRHMLEDPWWLALIHLYADNPEAGLARFRAGHPLLSSGRLSAIARAMTAVVEAGCAAAMIARGQDVRKHRKILVRNLKRLSRLRGETVAALHRLVLAMLHAADGNLDRATVELSRAAVDLDAVGLRLFAAAARARQGSLLGGPRGNALVQEAHEVFALQGVLKPERWVRLLAPGFERSSTTT